MTKLDLEKLEAEVISSEKSLTKARDRIREEGGAKTSIWALMMRGRIASIKNKINDLKSGKSRIDELTPAELEIEKDISEFESKLGLKEN